MSNRAAITIRLNLEDQREMRDLMAFYKRDAKTIMKMAYALMIESTREVKKQVEAREAAAKEATPSTES